MTESLDAVDESFGRLSPADARAHGIALVYGYMSNDPAKNLTAANIKAYHAEGIAVWLGWESDPGRPMLGASAGAVDGAAAREQLWSLMKQVGYQPQNPITIPFSCDKQITTQAELTACLNYYMAADEKLKVGGFARAGAYGQASLITDLDEHGLTRGLFQTLAWSAGAVSGAADLYQFSINHVLAGTSVDYDHIISTVGIGAWFPPGSPNDVPVVVPPKPAPVVAPVELDALMFVRFPDAPKNRLAIYVTGGESLTWLTPTDWAGLGKPAFKDLPHSTSNLYLLPISSGTPDPRK